MEGQVNANGVARGEVAKIAMELHVKCVWGQEDVMNLHPQDIVVVVQVK